VARPDDFRENVASILDGGVGLLAYPDHHEYSDVDVRRMVSEASGRALVVTEKDAVKLGAWATELPDARVLTQRLVWESGREEIEMRLGWLAGGHQ
jgi:tetraacyldisaccharide-1-P 4'-kinase